MMRRRATLGCAAAVLLIVAGAAHAESEHGPLAPIVRASPHMTASLEIADPQIMATEAERETLGDALSRFGDAANRTIFGFNAWVFSGWNAVMPSSGVGAALGTAAGNMVQTWISEPLTAASYVIAGRYGEAGIAGQRFLVNSLLGWGGLRDAATERGLVVPPADIGLALCALGTPSGPYTVVPLAGPRTLRDGVADIVVVNWLLFLVLAPLGVPTGTIVLIVLVDDVVQLAMMRQIDAVSADHSATGSFQEVRAAYLADREARCERLRAGRAQVS